MLLWKVWSTVRKQRVACVTLRPHFPVLPGKAKPHEDGKWTKLMTEEHSKWTVSEISLSHFVVFTSLPRVAWWQPLESHPSLWWRLACPLDQGFSNFVKTFWVKCFCDGDCYPYGSSLGSIRENSTATPALTTSSVKTLLKGLRRGKPPTLGRDSNVFRHCQKSPK